MVYILATAKADSSRFSQKGAKISGQWRVTVFSEDGGY